MKHGKLSNRRSGAITSIQIQLIVQGCRAHKVIQKAVNGRGTNSWKRALYGHFSHIQVATYQSEWLKPQSIRLSEPSSPFTTSKFPGAGLIFPERTQVCTLDSTTQSVLWESEPRVLRPNRRVRF